MIQALRAFAATAVEGSFSAAARRLGLSQPAVSEHVRSLETHFGLPLFERVGREIRLTTAGSRLYEHCGRVLTALEDLEHDLAALRAGSGGVLEVAASPIPGESVLPLLLPRFRSLFPGIQVRESIAETPELVARILRREVELAVIGGPLQDERLEMAFLARDEFALVARRDHPLAARGPLRMLEVCEYPLVVRGEGSGARTAVEAALLAAGVPREEIRLAAELGSTEAVKRAVEAGLGVGFVSICTLPAAGPAGELRVLPLADIPPSRNLLIITERGRPLTALAESFRAFLLTVETLREVAAYTQLPPSLRPLQATTPDQPRASPASGLEADPLLPPRPRPETVYRLARLPRTDDERLVAGLLTEAYGSSRRGVLLERLGEELRKRESEAGSLAPDVDVFRVWLNREEAVEVLDRLVGDLLVEVEP